MGFFWAERTESPANHWGDALEAEDGVGMRAVVG